MEKGVKQKALVGSVAAVALIAAVGAIAVGLGSANVGGGIPVAMPQESLVDKSSTEQPSTGSNGEGSVQNADRGAAVGGGVVANPSDSAGSVAGNVSGSQEPESQNPADNVVDVGQSDSGQSDSPSGEGENSGGSTEKPGGDTPSEGSWTGYY